MSELSLFSRDGHLLELTIERLLVGELEPSAITGHLNDCAPCRAAIDAAMALSAPPMPAALRGPSNLTVLPGGVDSSQQFAPPLPRPPSRWRLPAAAGAGFAVAAAVFLAVLPPEEAPAAGDTQPEETFTLKGASIGLQAFQQDGDASHAIATGSSVSPGDRVRFGVDLREPGYLMVLGDDEVHPPYLVWPQDNKAAQIGGSSTLFDNAIELDATPGRERFVAVRCADAFDFARARDALEGVSFDDPRQAVMPGCDHEFIILERTTSGQESP